MKLCEPVPFDLFSWNGRQSWKSLTGAGGLGPGLGRLGGSDGDVVQLDTVRVDAAVV